MAVDLGRTAFALVDEVVFTDRDEFVSYRPNLISCCRIVSDPGFERALILLLDFLLSGLDDLWRLCNQHTVFRVKTGNPGCVVVVPIIVIRGNLSTLL